jgi:hypothetical protein
MIEKAIATVSSWSRRRISFRGLRTPSIRKTGKRADLQMEVRGLAFDRRLQEIVDVHGINRLRARGKSRQSTVDSRQPTVRRQRAP